MTGSPMLKYQKPQRLSLKDHPEYNERWLQDRIAEDPSLLGLGDLVLKDKERIHPKAGRLDLLFQDPESNRRYEVEIQLGATDESHIIRTIEYWDYERKRYRQYDHTAVIVAEDITSRFLNVISLFNGHIPLVAIQLNALQFGEHVSLLCTTVLDSIEPGLVEEDEEIKAATNRAYWEERASKDTLAMMDTLVDLIRHFEPDVEPKYNKFYIGLEKQGQPTTFVIFRPKKEWLRLEARLSKSEEIEKKLEDTGLDVMDYDARWRRYRLRLTREDVTKHKELITELMRRAWDES